tara:strand:- start:348 stop:680 length:333 start_codon:yes stop_codon:yes gene_type:complete
MSNTYTWNVVQCDRILSTGMINNLHYTINASDAEGTYTVGAYGSIGLKPADTKSMIPYDSVTEAETITWLQAVLGEEKVSEIYQALDNQLTEKKTPTTGTGVPWATTLDS